jgi:hypothetical protein
MFFYHLIGAILSLFFLFVKEPGFDNYWGIAFASLLLNGAMLLVHFRGGND